MPEWASVLGVGMLAAGYFALVGWTWAGLAPGVPRWASAPVLGWAIHTVLAAWLLQVTGWFWLAALAPVLAGLPLLRRPATSGGRPGLAVPCTAALACLPAAALIPKHVSGGVRLSEPVFDHAKVAIIDAIARGGVPPANPFYGGPIHPIHLAYYYWWHLGAAELAHATGCGGWTADAAMTWFTGFASLLLIGGLAGRLALPAMLLAFPAGLRMFLQPLERDGLLLSGTGLRGWLNQTSWAPQHMMAAAALLLAGLLLAGLADAPAAWSVLALAAVVAAGFGASAWVGGVVCAVSAPVCVLVLARRLPAAGRWRLLAAAAAAGALGLLMAAPLLRTEFAASLHRAGLPVALGLYPVLGQALPGHRLLDAVSFPLLLLIEFPVAATLGTLGIAHAARRGLARPQAAVLAIGLPGLAVCFCLRGTIDNNDLGWRAVLPALLAVLPYAAATLARAWRAGGGFPVLAAAPVLLGLADAVPLARDNLFAHPAPDDIAFAREPAMWRAVRALDPPGGRLAFDPSLDASMTLWPGAIGWALMADRPACYAGWATAQPFVPLPRDELLETDRAMTRIFQGHATAADMAGLARLRCAAALVTARDPAWRHDPFSAAPGWRLAGTAPGWRLYLAR